jgi:transcription initiation factor IIE alpha subunit
MGLFFSSCGEGEKNIKNTEHNHEMHADEVSYQCPMKCEGEKTYDEAGECPVCKMDLKEME